MNESHSLRDATIQDIQLELIRRTRFNAMNGERIVDSLLRHRDLWLACVLDRQGLPNYDEPSLLLADGLIKLRDLPDNIWNTDTLFILTRNREQARQLEHVIEKDNWSADVIHVCDDSQELNQALGIGRQEYGLVSAWWD